MSFNAVKVRMPQRTTISFQLSNPLGAADLIAHGSGHDLRRYRGIVEQLDAAASLRREK